MIVLYLIFYLFPKEVRDSSFLSFDPCKIALPPEFKVEILYTFQLKIKVIVYAK